jgi:hypothetical protein
MASRAASRVIIPHGVNLHLSIINPASALNHNVTARRGTVASKPGEIAILPGRKNQLGNLHSDA